LITSIATDAFETLANLLTINLADNELTTLQKVRGQVLVFTSTCVKR
jgi:hypothetical protein